MAFEVLFAFVFAMLHTGPARRVCPCLWKCYFGFSFIGHIGIPLLIFGGPWGDPNGNMLPFVIG